MRRRFRWIGLVGWRVAGFFLVLLVPLVSHRLPGERIVRAEAGENAPPFDLKDAAAIKEGAALFARSCSLAYCHGKEGRAGAAPRLRGREFEPDFLYSLISQGEGKHLPFKDRYPPEQLWKIIAYILSLSGAED